MKTILVMSGAILLAFASIGCAKKNQASFKEGVQRALEQADLKGVSVSEDKAKNTITLSGKLHSEEAKQQASLVAQSAAGERIVANEISVQPVGLESQAKEISSNLDDAIEKNYQAALIAQGLDKQSIDFRAKNGLLTLTGKVRSADARQTAEQIASNVPNVTQVLNQIEVKR
jgi:osmotically-inducible protein OsmY